MNKIWFKKLTATFLLLILLAITAIQLLHSHSYNTVLTWKKNSTFKAQTFTVNDPSQSGTRCFICEYQLTRDADVNNSSYCINNNFAFDHTIRISYSFSSADIISVFETRGPPALLI